MTSGPARAKVKKVRELMAGRAWESPMVSGHNESQHWIPNYLDPASFGRMSVVDLYLSTTLHLACHELQNIRPRGHLDSWMEMCDNSRGHTNL